MSVDVFIFWTRARNVGIGIERQMTVEMSRKDEVGLEGMERVLDVFDGRDENSVVNLCLLKIRTGGMRPR